MKRSKRGAAEPTTGTLSIGALSRATRIPVETLRTWERRYGSPMPLRKPSGHRVYALAEVEHLRRASRLLAQGHRAADVLPLPAAELDALASLAGHERAPARAVQAAGAGHAESLAGSIERMLRAAEDFDRGALMDALRTHYVRLGPLRFLQDLAGPFMVAVGRAWREKALEIRHEHFASAALTDFLHQVREPLDEAARGPIVTVAMLPGDPHPGGLLMVSVLLAHRGWRVLYLGPNTPVAEIAAATRTGGVEAVVLSISPALPAARSAAALVQLRRALPPRVPVWVGGAGAPPATKGVERFDSLELLDARLATFG